MKRKKRQTRVPAPARSAITRGAKTKRTALSEGGPLRIEGGTPTILPEALRLAAMQASDRGIVYIQSDGSEMFQSYEALLKEAERIMTGLRKLGLKPQAKVMLQLDSNRDFIPAFWGCVLGGFVPVPLAAAPSYSEINHAVNKLHNAWKLLDQPIVLSSTALAPGVRSLIQLLGIERLRVETVDNLRACDANQHWHVSQPDDVVILLLTSGTTGLPKAVMQSHRALLHGAAATALMNGFTSDDVSLNWLPLDHVGGIVMFHLRDVYLSCQQIHVQTESILREPLRWLDLISRHRATVTWAPNFAYGLVTAKADEARSRRWDLSSMRFILNGGEAIVAKTARKFVEVLRPSGLSPTAMHPAWGMSETSSGVTYSDKFSLDSTTDDDPFVEVGRPIPGVSVRIVDARNKVVKDETIGFLQIKGPTVTSGYYKDPKLSEEVFTDDGWFKTGDLGFVRNGHLTITGREKDVIIVNGINYYSHEIEAIIEQIDGVATSYTAACAVRTDNVNTDRLAVFFHPLSWDDGNLMALLKAIRATVVRQAGINPDYLVPLKKEEVPKTSIGKIQRSQLRWRFQAGEFDTILKRFGTRSTPDFPHIHRTAAKQTERTDVERQLAAIWQEVFGVPQVRINDNFFEFGGHSLLATLVISRVRETFEVELPLRAFFEAPTVASLAQKIAATLHQEQNSLPERTIPVSREEEHPLSFSQQRLWFLDQLEPNSSVYNITTGLRLRGPLNLAALEQSLNEIVRRHETLRTTFSTLKGQPFQVVSPFLAVTLPVVDLSHFSETEGEDEARRLSTQEAQRSFDLGRGPLVRWILLCLGHEDHILLVTMHHIVSDGWSMGIFFRELSDLYDAFSKGKASLLRKLPVQYVDFAHWQRQWLQGEVLQTQVRYWKKHLDDLSALRLPTDRPRPAVQSYRGASQSLTLGRKLTDALKALSQKESVTLFMTLLAAFKVLLHRSSSQEDIVVGTPIAARNRLEIEGLIGFFVNTLVLRTDLSGNPSFCALVKRVREVALGAYAHQDLPFEKLVEELVPERTQSQIPLFQVMFVFHNEPTEAIQLSGLNVCPFKIDPGVAKFDLTLDVRQGPKELSATIEYNTDLFNSVTILRMLGHFQTLLEGIVADPNRRLSDLSILTERERHQLLLEWNNTENDYPKDKCIHELFEQQVERSPDAIAVVFEDQQLTYRELNERANQLSHYLGMLGVGPEGLVGICMERSLEMMVGLLGILKAGGAYVPMDPAYPKERLAFMIEDVQVPVLLTQQRLAAGLIADRRSKMEDTDARSSILNPQMKVVCLDSDWETIAQQSKQNPPNSTKGENLSYVIYTSGSTGRAKGILTEHRAICNQMLWMQANWPLADDDRVVQKTSFSFDVSLREFFWPLLAGAHLIMARHGCQKDSAYLRELIVAQGITTIHFVPSMLSVFLEQPGLQACHSLRRVLCGGDVLSLELQQRFFGRLQADLLHFYGPTEASIAVTEWTCEREDRWGIVPLGHPAANTQIYLLDGHLQPVPIGVPGELHIGGNGLARGYLNRPELTAEKFIPNPFSDKPGARLYKTGDLACYLPDGSIEFLGRIDHQVKIHGFRIELGEIEAVLAGHPALEGAVVLAREDEPGAKRLVAYVVANKIVVPSTSELRSFLKSKLPDYMLPSAFVFLDTLPLTPNGKVDRRALPPPQGIRSELQEVFVAPRTPAEETIAAIWAAVLKLDQVGIHDNFFALGGHSLLATQVVSRIRAAFQVGLPLRSLFEKPTIAELAFALTQIRGGTGRVEEIGRILADIESLSDEEDQQLPSNEGT